MGRKPDLLAEHAALLRERDELAAMVAQEWRTMSAQVAQARQQRHDQIEARLKAIERSRTWLREHPPAVPTGTLEIPS